MVSTVPQGSLHERAFGRLADTDAFGVASVEEARGTPLFDSAIGLLPGAKSIVVVGMEIYREMAELDSPKGEVGHGEPRALFKAHMDFLAGRITRALYELAKVYRGVGYRTIVLPSAGTPQDSRYLRAILSFKHAAEYAGIGTIGRSSLLISPKFGPRIRFGCLLTDAEIPAGQRLGDDPCAGCPGVCIQNCPAGALSWPAAGQPYAINKFACRSFRESSGGCSNCLGTCPAGG